MAAGATATGSKSMISLNPLLILNLNRLLTHLLSFFMGVSLSLLFYLKTCPFDFLFQPQAVQLLSSAPPPSHPPLLFPPPPSLLPLPLPLADDRPYLRTMHNLTDQELLRMVSLSSSSSVINYHDTAGAAKILKTRPKVAFLFLTAGQLPLSLLWEIFFRGHQGLCSIYVHPHPDYNDTTTPPSSVFYGRRIPSQPVSWGTISVVDAERRLLANAILDSSNQRFVLLSESCIPLFNFTTVYHYLIHSKHTFLSLYDLPSKAGRGRYNSQMSPLINITQWRKGSQWFELNRELALQVVSDRKYYSVFKERCVPPCYNDEHYIPTLVNMYMLAEGDGEKSGNRSVTWVNWSRGGPHPKKYGVRDITPEFLNWIRFSSQCLYNGNTTNLCFLFARKFGYNALRPLLRHAPLLFG